MPAVPSPTRTTISPFGGPSRGELAGEVRQIAAADRLEQLRQLARHDGGPLAEDLGGVGEHLGQAVRRLEEDQRARDAGDGLRAASGARRSLRGRKPSKKNRSVGRPETTSAVSIAEGPGIGVTGSPAAIAA